MKFTLLFFLFPLSIFAETQKVKQSSQVLVSTSLLADLVQQILPYRFQIQSLVGHDRDPHHFELTAQDLEKYARADLFLYFGNDFEPWIQLMKKQKSFGEKSFAAGESLASLKNRRGKTNDHAHHDHDHHQGTLDPHFWHDPRKVIAMNLRLRDHLQKKYPQDSVEIRKNVERLNQKIETLFQGYQKKFSEIPGEKNVITPHDAFQYLEEPFQLNFSSPMGWSSSQEPTAKQVAKIIQLIKKKKITCLFTENSTNSRLLKNIAQETGVKISGELISDSLSLLKAKTYLEMMTLNLDALLTCLNSQPKALSK